MNITGKLENWVYNKKQNVIVGNLYGDIHNRWEDGTPIVTSRLRAKQESTPKEGAILQTANSTYLLGTKKDNNNVTK